MKIRTNIFSAVIIFLLIVTSGTLYCQSSGFGAGIKIGEPTGLTAKYWVSQTNSFTGTFGYSMLRADKMIYVGVDYLYHNYDLIKSEEELPVFYGFGTRIRAGRNDQGSFGIRGVGGISWHMKPQPVEIFVEFAPVFRLFPSTGLDLEAGLGARYYFK